MKQIINLLKTGVLFTILTGIVLLIGYYFGGRGAIVPFFIISLVMNLAGYWFSASIALKMARARPITEAEDPEMYRDLRELSDRMDLPLPRLYMSNDAQPNAFATGRGPSNGVVCITEGIKKILSREELKGVLAHELAHIKNRDVLIGTMAAIMAGAVSSFAQLAIFGGGNDEDRNPVVSILMIIAAPIAATLIQLSISRAREYVADESAAYATKRPQDLASALQKIENFVKQIPSHTNPALASLYIQNPLSGKRVSSLFSTHPPTASRVERLNSLKIY